MDSSIMKWIFIVLLYFTTQEICAKRTNQNLEDKEPILPLYHPTMPQIQEQRGAPKAPTTPSITSSTTTTTTTTTTPIQPPGTVQSLTFSSVSGDLSSLNLHFKCLSKDERHGKATHYLIKYTTDTETALSQCGMSKLIQKTEGVTVDDDGSCNLTTTVPVTPDRHYKFTIQAFNNLPGKIASFETSTKTDPPGAVRDLRNKTETASSVVLQWTTPENVNGMIHSYRIKLKSEGTCLLSHNTHCGNFNIQKKECTPPGPGLTLNVGKIEHADNMNSHSVKVTGLLSYTDYTATVVAINSAGSGCDSKVNFKTDIGVPDVPTSFDATVDNSSSIILYWSPSKHQAGPTNYIIGVYGNVDHRTNNCVDVATVTVTGFKTSSTVVTNLCSYTNYNLTIMASTITGNSSLVAVKKHIRTGIGVPDKPLTFNATVDSSSSITLSWSQSKHQAGPTNYIIGFNGNVDHRTNNCVDMATVIVTGYRTLSEDVQNLCSYTNYTFTIMASTSAGNSSDNAPTQRLQTQTGAADPPQKLKVETVTSSSVRLSWAPSSHQSGPTDYVVDVEEQPNLQSEAYVLNRTITVQGFKNNTVDITGLTSYWKYKFSVKARTSIHPDSPSVNAEIQTLQSPPGRVENIQVSALPDNYTAVKLTWECPEERKRHGPISNFTVQYSVKVETVGNFPDGDPCTKALSAIVSVDPDQSYNFTVFANAKFKGMSVTSTYNATEGRPGKVGNLKITQKDSDYMSVTVSFSTPQIPNGHITHYMLSYFMVSKGHSNPDCEVLKQITNQTYIKIQANLASGGLNSKTLDVSPETTYSFQVTAFNSMEGIPAYIKYTTGSDDPGPIRDLNIHDLTSDSVLVTWKPPAQPNGFLRGYRLRLNRLQPNIADECFTAADLSCSGDKLSDVPTEAWCNEDKIIIATLNVTDPLSYQFTRLRPDTAFKLEVEVVNRHGLNKQQSVVFYTNESEPGPVTKLTFSSIPGDYSGFILHFACLDIDERHGNVTYYIIKYTTNTETSESKCGMSAVIQNASGLKIDDDGSCNFSKRVTVTPERNYNFTIQAFNPLAGKVAAFPTVTPFGSPGQVKDLKVRTQTYSSATIQWHTPQHVNGMIHSYQLSVGQGGTCIVRYFTDCGDFETNQEQRKSEKECRYTGTMPTPTFNKITNTGVLHYITVNGLLSYTNYTVSVVPINTRGLGPEALVDFKTDVGVPSEPGHFHATVNSSSTITLFWSQNGHQAGPTTYAISVYGNVDHITNNCIDKKVLPVSGYHTSSRVVTNLCSYTNYTFTIMASTSAGKSSNVPVNQTVQTRTSVAYPPKTLKVETVTVTSLRLSWVPSRHQCGLTDYIVDVEEQAHLQSDSYVLNRTITVHGFNTTTVFIEGLTSYWKYIFSVRARTSVEPDSSTVIAVVQTLQTAPGRVQNIHVSALPDNYTAVKLTWECPEERKRHGPISHFTVQSSDKVYTFGRFPDGGPCRTPQTEVHTAILPVLPEQSYIFTVFATAKYEGLKNLSESFYAEAGKPPTEMSSDIFTTTTSKTSESTTDSTFLVSVNSDLLRDSTNGQIVMTGLLVMKDKAAKDVPNNVTDLKKWKGWKKWKKDYKGTYRPTPDSWLIPQIRRKRSANSGSQSTTEFIVGANANCENLQDIHCNGPLEAETTYRVISVACTTAGCTASTPYGPFKTKAKSIVAAVVGGVLAALVVVGVVIGVLVYRRRRKRKQSKYTDDDPDEEKEESVDKTRPKKLCDFPRLVDEYHRDSERLFSLEWREIGLNSPSHPYENATLEANRVKNRYTNILAYDHTRVKLVPKTEDEGSDYINANYIQGYSRPREYIASQGPLAGTVDDFWQMIWEQNVPIIVQLTDLYEGGRRKLSQYWPEEVNVPQTYGEVQVEIVSLSSMNKYTIKVFKVSLGSRSRQVKHFFLQDWQDYNANLKTGDVIDFTRYVRNELKPTDKGPVLVHCSAGVGRTGTFICVDYFLQMIDKADLEDSIDIFSFVLKMRDCRPMMVQSESQYTFVHDAVKEMIERKKKALAGEVDEVLYENQAFEPGEDPEENIYENT